MTSQQEQPDVTRRRHVNRLREELGLTRVPRLVGTQIQTITSDLTARIEEQLRSQAPRHTAQPSPGARNSQLAIASRTMEEFARIVEGRPLPTPTIAAILGRSARQTSDPEMWRLALRSTFEILREAAREHWTRLPQVHPYVALLDTALNQYVQRLYASATNALQPPRLPGLQPADDARDALAAIVEQRWGNQPVQLYLRISTRTQPESATATGAPANAASNGRRDAVRVLRLSTKDHLVTVVPHVVPPPRPSGATAPGVALWVGPVAPSDIALAYDAALLLYRLVAVGVAAPPPEPLPLPDFGFLRPYPSEASVQKIASLLEPLTDQRSIHRRLTLAQTLQLRLRTAVTSQSLADQLGVHSQTVRNHLGVLRDIYDSADLDFGRDALAIQAALDLVFPLWEHERTRNLGRSTPRSHAAPNMHR